MDPPVSLGCHGRDVTADTHPAGDPGWGQDPPTPLAKEALGKGVKSTCRFLHPPHLREDAVPEGLGRVCGQGLGWDPSVTRLLRVSLSREPARVSRAFLPLCHLLSCRVKRGTGSRKKQERSHGS